MINLVNSSRPEVKEDPEEDAPEVGATKEEFLKFLLIPKDIPPAPPESHFKEETKPEEEPEDQEEEEIRKEFTKKEYSATAAAFVGFIDKIIPLGASIIMGKPSQVYKADPEGYKRFHQAATDYAESLKIRLKPGHRLTFVFAEVYSLALVDVTSKGVKWIYKLITKSKNKPSWIVEDEPQKNSTKSGAEEKNKEDQTIMEQCAFCHNYFDRKLLRKYHIKAIGEDRYFCDQGHYNSWMNQEKHTGKGSKN